MGRISAVWARRAISSKPGGATGPTMTSGAAIRESSGKIQICCQVSGSIAQPRALPFRLRKLALKELAASADRPKGVTIDEKQRRLWLRQTTMPRTRHEGTDFLGQRFTDAFMGGIGLLGAIKQLRRRDGRPEQHDSNEANEKTSHGGFSFLSNKIPSADIADESAPSLRRPLLNCHHLSLAMGN
jgi:hypothetical protein